MQTELKAVEILTLMQRVDDVSTRQMQKEINEALAELQELTQEKSCDKCSQIDCPMYLEAINYGVVANKKDFYCNHYTPKG